MAIIGKPRQGGAQKGVEETNDRITHQIKSKIREELALGVPLYKIKENLVDNKYKLPLIRPFTLKSAGEYIALLRKEIKAEWKEEYAELREKQLERMEKVYEESMKRGDRQSATNILKEINKVTGLYEPQKIDITSGGEQVKIVFGMTSGDNNDD